MFVIGTAGHVDHGKSTLVKALTGIDPDRLREEKERGMTIDLGFAWLSLPSGREVSIVDVPGHERFIRNMLAGIEGIDIALLVIAADESVMPQTREHLAILDLLQIQGGVVVITKLDLVDIDFADLVRAEVEEMVLGTVLEKAPIVAVSAVTGEALPKLLEILDNLLTNAKPKRDIGRPRIPIDRSFTMAGFGTVVTGTLVDGTLTAGQEVDLVLARKRTRVRGLQTHRRKVQQATPGTRVAVNLVGVDHQEVKRGDVLTQPGWLRPTTALDARLRLLPSNTNLFKHNSRVTVHIGAGDIPATVRLLENEAVKPGQETWAQIKLDTPAAVTKGDFFVIRSSTTTLGGGVVLDPYPARHRRSHGPTLQRLSTLDHGSPEQTLLQLLESTGPTQLKDLTNKSSLSTADVEAHIRTLMNNDNVITLGGSNLASTTMLCDVTTWVSLRERVQRALDEHHRNHPLLKGPSREELRSRLHLPSPLFPHILARLVQEGAAIEEPLVVRLPGRFISLTPDHRQRMQAYVDALREDRYSPPTDHHIEPELVVLLEEEGQVVRVSNDVVFEAQAYWDQVEKVKNHIRTQGKITLAEVRNLFHTSRKYALPLLEYMDKCHITRRVGLERDLR